jgi:hypothetical protein
MTLIIYTPVPEVLTPYYIPKYYLESCVYMKTDSKHIAVPCKLSSLVMVERAAKGDERWDYQY